MRQQLLGLTTLATALTLSVTQAQAVPKLQVESRPIVDRAAKQSWGEASANVDLPYAAVLKSLRTYSEYATFFPHISKSKVLAQRSTQALVYLEAGILNGAYTIWAQALLREKSKGAGKTIDLTMREGNLDDFKAHWEVAPLKDGKAARVTLRLYVAPRLPVPSSIVMDQNVMAARKAVRSLVRYTSRTL